MRQFIKRALQKADKLKPEQWRDLLISSANEIDRLETVMDSLPRGILVCDTAHNLVLANKAARRFLSIVSYEQAKESAWSVIGDEMVAEFLANTLLSSDKAEEREFDIEVNGVQRLLSVSVMPVVQDRQVSGSLVLVDDITERRGREAKMRRMENLASLTTLAAGVAHEIKNPLGSLSIHVQLIQKTLAKSKKRLPHGQDMQIDQIEKYLGVVNEEVDRLNRIVLDFLFAVRPMNAELRKGDLNALITELVKFVAIELQDARIESVLDLAEELPPLYFDGGLMKQALLNLIKNAAAAMEGGGRLSISTEVLEGEARIIVADTGIGIPEDELGKIFEPYFTTKDNGTGLGLTVVFKVIREHQGDIAVRSREGEGTVFIITLPLPQIDRRLIAYNTQDEAVTAGVDQ